MKITNRMIDPELRFFGRLAKLFNPSFSIARLRFFYGFSRKLKMKVKADTFAFSEQALTRADGSSMKLCVFAPLTPPPQPVPGVLWLHGGGYAIGAPEEAARIARLLIAASPCVVIAPDYRLSPEAPFPAALDDSMSALIWLKENASALGVRDDQLMVGGDSAGGGLAAALTLLARDRGDVRIACQMPLYPMLDDRQTSPSATENNAPIWNTASNRNAWQLYLGDLAGTPDLPATAAAARATDYHGLPPAITFVGDIEPFCDETKVYVENLRQAGVPVQFEVFPGAYHAFQQMCPKAVVSQKAIAFFVAAYKYAAEHYFAEQA